MYGSFIIKIKNGNATLNKDIFLCKDDIDVVLKFKVDGCPYTFSDGKGIEGAVFSTVTLQNPSGEIILLSSQPVESNVIVCKIPNTLIDEITEIGNYNFQIKLTDADSSEISLPIIYNQFHVNPTLSSIEDVSSEINQGSVGFGHVSVGDEVDIFNIDKSYNKTVWADKDVITAQKLNKIEDALSYSFDNLIIDKMPINKEINLSLDKYQSVSTDNDLTVNLPAIDFHNEFVLYITSSQPIYLTFKSLEEVYKYRLSKGVYKCELAYMGTWVINLNVNESTQNNVNITSENIINALGFIPANSTKVNELFQNVSNGKQLIATAITDKGVIASSDDTFQTMATKINNIQGLKSDVVEFSQMNDLVTSYLADAESKYTNDNGNNVSVISNYAKTTNTKEDFPNKMEFILDSAANFYIQSESNGYGRMLPMYSGNKFYFRNEIPNETYQYLIKDNNGSLLQNGKIKPTGKLRMIEFSGYMRNFRDLGGWICDGGTVKYGMIYRSGVPSNLERLDFQRIKDMKISRQIDFRYDSESNYLSESPLGSNIRFDRIPINGAYITMIDNTKDDYNNTKRIFRTIFDAVLHDEPLTYNCSLGRDRTGTVSFMILGLLGVERKYIDIDYELSSFSSIGDYKVYRTSNSYRELATYLDKFGGNTLRDNIVWWFIHAGFSLDEINAFRKVMINGNPETLTSDKFTGFYTVTQKLTNCTSDYSGTSVIEHSSLTINIAPIDDNYDISSIVVTMNGLDITSSVVNDMTINITDITGDVIITAIANIHKDPINVLPMAQNLADENPFNDIGYQNGKYLAGASPWTDGSDSTHFATGYIPYDIGSNKYDGAIYIKGLDINIGGSSSHTRIHFCSSDKSVIAFAYYTDSMMERHGFTVDKLGDKYYKIDFNYSTTYSSLGHIYYLRFSFEGTGDNVFISIDVPLDDI